MFATILIELKTWTKSNLISYEMQKKLKCYHSLKVQAAQKYIFEVKSRE